MIIRYSNRKTGYKNNNNMNNKDIYTDYGTTVYGISKFFLVSYSVGVIFDYFLSICSCILVDGSRTVVFLLLSYRPERLSLFFRSTYYSILVHLFASFQNAGS